MKDQTKPEVGINLKFERTAQIAIRCDQCGNLIHTTRHAEYFCEYCGIRHTMIRVMVKRREVARSPSSKFVFDPSIRESPWVGGDE